MKVILVDTSVWVAHLREGKTGLEDLLNETRVLCHPFIIGELACGNLKNRAEILSLLSAMPMATTAEHEEVMRFIETRRLMGKGLGYVDLHLVASAVLSDVAVWTFDKKLDLVCSELGLAYRKS